METQCQVGLRWHRWEVTREGIAFWPEGERVILTSGPSDRITPKEAVIGGEHVPLRQMSYPLASRLVMAMGERAGSRLSRSRSTWLVPALLFGATVGLGAFVAEGARDPEVIFGAIFVSLALPVGEMIFAAKRRRKDLFHGRAMLERLGW